MATTQTKNGQTLLDVAMQQSGDATAAAALAIANEMSVTEKLAIGTELQNVDVMNSAVVDVFATQKINPASDDTYEILEGIGYWRIGIDFEIS